MIYSDSEAKISSFDSLPNLFLLLASVCYCSPSSATDSTGVPPPTITTPAITALGPCTTSTLCQLYGQSSNIIGSSSTASAPYYAYMNSSKTINSFTVPYDGTYQITLNFIFKQIDNPAYYWLDLWADNIAYDNTAIHTRILYSGDAPSIINVGSGNSTGVVTYSSTVHLRATSVIYAPRIWSTCTNPSFCGNFQYSTCSSSSLGGCISVYLLSSP